MEVLLHRELTAVEHTLPSSFHWRCRGRAASEDRTTLNPDGEYEYEYVVLPQGVNSLPTFTKL